MLPYIAVSAPLKGGPQAGPRAQEESNRPLAATATRRRWGQQWLHRWRRWRRESSGDSRMERDLGLESSGEAAQRGVIFVATPPTRVTLDSEVVLRGASSLVASGRYEGCRRVPSSRLPRLKLKQE